ncbi:MAG: lipoyl(octanoyl) transferase LipB [Deltaproteobacteria bacterium]|nr:lipoyl(octanoyl) transferase LipB [Deltaproteobacteria bacterium]
MVRFVRLPGLTSYQEAHALQKTLLEARIVDHIPDVVLLLEHEDVITVARSRCATANVLAAEDVPVVAVERGGDVTWHGPGQLVAYPIVKLEGRRADLHLYLRSLEEAVIGLLDGIGLSGARDERNTGVWLPCGDDRRKVCAIGVASRRWVTWHGLALNVTSDLTQFQRLNPCGLDAGVMTRLADHLKPCPTVGELVEPLAHHLAHALALEVEGKILHAGQAEVLPLLTG